MKLTNADMENWHKLSSTIGNFKIDKTFRGSNIFVFLFQVLTFIVGVMIVKVKPMIKIDTNLVVICLLCGASYYNTPNIDIDILLDILFGVS